MKLNGRVALVTGAGSGLGRQIAVRFANEGASLVINDLRRESAENVASEIRSAGGNAMVLVADVSDSVEVGAMFEEMLETHPRLDILVNNAGIALLSDATKQGFSRVMQEVQSVGRAETTIGAARDMTDSQWRRTLSVHLDGTFYCLRAALRVMEPQGYGKIINMASIAGLAGLPASPDYSAAKAGIIGLTKSVARDVIARGIYVNAIAPGFIDTPLLDVMDPMMRQVITAQTPIGRLGTADEIASLALYLASDESSFTVGQVISANGGYYV